MQVIKPDIHCKGTGLPGIALTPLAIQNLTGSTSLGLPDKLIVAARHHEVSLASNFVQSQTAQAC